MTTPSGTIVVGVDGSESSARALHWAAQQASTEHRPMTLVHTMPRAAAASLDADLIYSAAGLRMMEDEGRRLLAEARTAVEAVDPGLEVFDVLGTGDPRLTLLGLSGEAELVVIGSRGRGPVAGLLLGSVGVALARHAECPVVVHRPGDQHLPRRGVVVACDAGPDSHPVLELAYRMADLWHLPLTVVHCVWDVGAGTAAAALVPEQGADLEREAVALATVMAGMREKYPDVDVTTDLVRGLPHEVLLRLADTLDLLVVGMRHRSRVAGVLFGSLALSVLEHATCPVAVVPVDDEGLRPRRATR